MVDKLAPIVSEGPESAVPGIIVYKGYESYQGINQLIDHYQGNDRKVLPPPSNYRGPQPRLHGVPIPAATTQNSTSGTYIMHPPSASSRGGTTTTTTTTTTTINPPPEGIDTIDLSNNVNDVEV